MSDECRYVPRTVPADTVRRALRDHIDPAGATAVIITSDHGDELLVAVEPSVQAAEDALACAIRRHGRDHVEMRPALSLLDPENQRLALIAAARLRAALTA